MNGRKSKELRKEAGLILGHGTNKYENYTQGVGEDTVVYERIYWKLYKAAKRQYKKSRRNLL